MVDLIKDFDRSNLLGNDRQLYLANKDLRKILAAVDLEHASQIYRTPV